MLFLRRIPLLVWFVIPTIILVIAGVWFFTKGDSSAMKEGSELEVEKVDKPVEGAVEYKVESRTHIPTGTKVTNYNSNPPNSGDHWGAPAKNGIYDNALPDEELVHNLEHGYIWISYRPAAQASESSPSADLKPGISVEDKKSLEELVNKDDWKMVLAPRDTNDSVIALASWGRVLKMDSLNLDKVKGFIRVYRGRGPEKTPN